MVKFDDFKKCKITTTKKSWIEEIKNYLNIAGQILWLFIHWSETWLSANSEDSVNTADEEFLFSRFLSNEDLMIYMSLIIT